MSVGRIPSLNKVLKRGSVESLAATATGLDSLISASTAQELVSDDINSLKSYSERIAIEAEESAKEQKKQQNYLDQLKHQQEHSKDNVEMLSEESVEEAK